MKTNNKFNLDGRQCVRLFPSSHIKSDREAELRASASLLAMACAVSEFGKRMVRIAGSSAGTISCFTEVSYQLDIGKGKPPKKIRPDGVITVKRGKKCWVALVEVKVGDAKLEPKQVNNYHKLARQIGADAVITVSNQPASQNNQPPVNLDGRNRIPVTHFSWERLLSEAQILSRKKEVSDEDQKWMLDEWIRFIDDPKSRIIEPPELGTHWHDIINAARTRTLKQSKKGLRDVATNWRGYLRKEAMRLRAELRVDVELSLSRKEKKESDIHIQRLANDALECGKLTGTFDIPDAAGNLYVDLFLESRSVQYSLEVDAPTEGRQATRITWLARQLKRIDKLPADLELIVDWSTRGLSTRVSVSKFVDNPLILLVDENGIALPKDVNPKRFHIQRTTRLVVTRGRSTAPVLDGISNGIKNFYNNVVEGISPFVPRVPQMMKQETPTTKNETKQESNITE